MSPTSLSAGGRDSDLRDMARVDVDGQGPVCVTRVRGRNEKRVGLVFVDATAEEQVVSKGRASATPPLVEKRLPCTSRGELIGMRRTSA